MGRFRLIGAGVAAFLDSLLTRRVADMGVGKIRYSLMTSESGGILDDVLAYRLDDLIACRILHEAPLTIHRPSDCP